MPTFKFLNTETNEQFEDFLSNSTKEELLKKNAHIVQMPTAFNIVSMIGSIDSKTDNTFKEVLSKISEKHPSSPLAERYAKKSIKDVKTNNIVERHMKKWKNE